MEAFDLFARLQHVLQGLQFFGLPCTLRHGLRVRWMPNTQQIDRIFEYRPESCTP